METTLNQPQVTTVEEGSTEVQTGAQSIEGLSEITNYTIKQCSKFKIGDSVKVLIDYLKEGSVPTVEVFSICNVKDESIPIMYTLKGENGDILNIEIPEHELLECTEDVKQSNIKESYFDVNQYMKKINENNYFDNAEERKKLNNEELLDDFNQYVKDSSNLQDTTVFVPIKEAIMKVKDQYPEESDQCSTNTVKTRLLKLYTEKLNIQKVKNRYFCSKELLNTIQFDYENFTTRPKSKVSRRKSQRK